MARTYGLIKNSVITATIACAAAFAQAATPVSPVTKLEQAAAIGPAGKLAIEAYAKPTNDTSLASVKKQLLDLPRNQIREASSAFHSLNLGERDQMREIGRMIAGAVPPDQVRQKINELKSPELRDGLIALQNRIEQDKKGTDKGAPYRNMQEGIKKLDDAAKTRETAFKTMVDEAAKGRLEFEMKQRRAGRNME